MGEEFYQSFLNQLQLIEPDFYWSREIDGSGDWTGTYAWGFKSDIIYSTKGRFKSFKEVVNNVSSHIRIHK